MAKPLLKTKLRLAAVKALREAVLNNLGRTIGRVLAISVLNKNLKRVLGWHYKSFLGRSECSGCRGGTGAWWPMGGRAAEGGSLFLLGKVGVTRTTKWNFEK